MNLENITSIDFITLELVLPQPKLVIEKQIDSVGLAVELGSPIAVASPIPQEELHDFVEIP